MGSNFAKERCPVHETKADNINLRHSLNAFFRRTCIVVNDIALLTKTKIRTDNIFSDFSTHKSRLQPCPINSISVPYKVHRLSVATMITRACSGK